MSVIMTFRVAGDPDKLEKLAAENQDLVRGISDRAQEHGLIAHRFYGSDGQIMVIDEWPDPASFQQFFEQERSTIEQMIGPGRDGRAGGHLLAEARDPGRGRLGVDAPSQP